jgi:hypothetical protein
MTLFLTRATGILAWQLVCAFVPFATLQADPIDYYIEGQLKKQHVPGASVAIVREGKIEKAKGYGLADVELNVPATERSVYQWGSQSARFREQVWGLLVDAACVGIIIWVASGLIMWWRLPRLRAWGAVAVGGDILSFAAPGLDALVELSTQS